MCQNMLYRYLKGLPHPGSCVFTYVCLQCSLCPTILITLIKTIGDQESIFREHGAPGHWKHNCIILY